MSWGDVWVSDARTRPVIDREGPQDPWLLAGCITREDRGFIEAMQRLRITRDSHAKSVDIALHLHTAEVALTRKGSAPDALIFEPHGLWVAIDLTTSDPVEGPRFAVFRQRVRAAGPARPAPRGQSGGTRVRAVLPLRGHAKSRESAVAWDYRG